MLFRILFIGIFISLPTSTFSNEKKGPPDGFSFGIGHIFSKSPYKGVERKNTTIPLVSYKNGRFWARGLNFSYKFLAFKNFQMSAFFSPELFGKGYKPSDSPYLTGMDEREGGINLGLSLSAKVKRINLRASTYKDIFGEHHGQVSKIVVGSGFPISLLFKFLPFTLFKINGGVKFFDKNYTNYYYGVREKEAQIYRPTYNLSSTSNLLFDTSLMVKIIKKMNLNFGHSKEWLDKDIYNSPIVERKTLETTRVFLTYLY